MLLFLVTLCLHSCSPLRLPGFLFVPRFLPFFSRALSCLQHSYSALLLCRFFFCSISLSFLPSSSSLILLFLQSFSSLIFPHTLVLSLSIYPLDFLSLYPLDFHLYPLNFSPYARAHSLSLCPLDFSLCLLDFCLLDFLLTHNHGLCVCRLVTLHCDRLV